MPAKKIKEEPAIVEGVSPAAGLKAAARLPAGRTQTTAVVKASALNDGKPDWRGTCAICLDLLPFESGTKDSSNAAAIGSAWHAPSSAGSTTTDARCV
eukprot:CAMPEP_0184115112 /NCGR_PEP_ID=MMETSP0974-20121125/19761_1 /TAXON_ID=483370 /ORGANISM="non described non described, Strain CCMP2097" /LENGTH=97 /DNA_ID=CAMNT_0026418223 /DNA_START=1 /DNA_END=292 /DNA_ORIENTATION=-